MIALVTTALSIIAVLLELWVQNKPQRTEKEANEATQDSRQALIDGDVAAVESRIDGLLQTGSGDSSPGGESAEDIQGRISRL